jgi:NAD(P)H-hydrate epimerase
MIYCEKLRDSLPQPVYLATEVANNEAQLATNKGISLYQLMEQAGAAVVQCIEQTSRSVEHALIFSGKGNNGGDGYVIARLLAEQFHCTVDVVILATADAIIGDAATALKQLRQAQAQHQINCHFISEEAQLTCLLAQLSKNKHEVIVDALLGTGFKGKVSPLFAQAIRWVNQQSAVVYSVDLPSGLNANTGTVGDVCIHANYTVTFIGVKRGLVTAKAAEYVGELYFAGLGLNQSLAELIQPTIFLQGEQALPHLGERAASSHKGSIGLAVTIGGNLGMPGAIRLASESALRCGAALVAICCQSQHQLLLATARPEFMFAPSNANDLSYSSFYDKAKVLLIGPGLGRDTWAEALAQLVFETDVLRVVDADALYFVAKHKAYASNWVLTPHPGEAATLLNCQVADIEADRYQAVKAIAQQYGGICVLKGAGSLISDGKRIFVNTSGNAGMASGGMGDVLSGVITALVMQMPDIFDATRLAVYLHGKAADIIAQQQGARGILASDLFKPLQFLVNQY